MHAGERKLATVLFADLVGSTSAASEQDPEVTRAMQRRLVELYGSEPRLRVGVNTGDVIAGAARAAGSAYLDPFALRALGLVRDDEQLLGQAAARFDSLGLAWHVGETRRLLGKSS